MDDLIKVSFEEVRNTASTIDSAAKQADQHLQDLRQQIQQLAQTYEGASSEAFQQQQGHWNQAADDLTATQAKIATAVHTAADNYQHTEQANTKRWA